MQHPQKHSPAIRNSDKKILIYYVGFVMAITFTPNDAVVLFPGVVGARNFTMECRKGRRKGLLSGLVFAWLLTSGCTVANRNIGK